MKRTRKLAILLGALILVIGSWLVLSHVFAEDSETAVDTGISVYSVNSQEITGLNWSYSGEDISLSKTDGQWTYDADSAFALDETIPEAMAEVISDITATTTVENAQALSEYGLEDPSCVITVTTADGQRVFSLGNENALTGEYYMLSDSGEEIYLVDAAIYNAFCYGLDDIAAPEDTT